MGTHSAHKGKKGHLKNNKREKGDKDKGAVHIGVIF